MNAVTQRLYILDDDRLCNHFKSLQKAKTYKKYIEYNKFLQFYAQKSEILRFSALKSEIPCKNQKLHKFHTIIKNFAQCIVIPHVAKSQDL